MVKDIKLFPNPTAGQAQLEFKPGMEAWVTVMNATGHIISQGTATGSFLVKPVSKPQGRYL